MLLHPQDIVQRKEKNRTDKTLWLSERILEDLVGVTANYLWKWARPNYSKTVPKHRRKQDILPDTGASWRWAKFNGGFYYDYDRLPDGRRALLPSKNALVEQYENDLAKSRQGALEMRIKEALKHDYKRFIAQYAEYGQEKCYALSKAAATVEAAAHWMQEKEIPKKKNTFFQDLAKVLDDLGVRYMPRNYRRIKDKVLPVLNGKPAHEVIALPREGNNNAKKFEDEEIISWIIQLASNPRNYTRAYVARKVQMLCYTTGKPVPSRTWIAEYLARPETKWLTQDRFGSGKHRAKYREYVRIKHAAYAGDCWQVDGTRVNFLPYKAEDGKMRHLYIVSIIDVHSGDILGWCFDTKESHEVYVNALAMACRNAGYLPYSLVFDQFPGHNTDNWKRIEKRLEKLKVDVKYTSVATGKAKMERTYGTLQTVFMQESDFYYGEGIMSKRDMAHRSPEYLKKQSKVARQIGWDYSQAVDEANRILEMYRTTPLCAYSEEYKSIKQSPMELHQESDKPNARQLEPWDFADLFWLEKSLSIRNLRIKTKIAGQSLEYDLPGDLSTTLKRVTIMYDLEDLDEVYVFEDSQNWDRQYLGVATSKDRVEVYGPDADFSAYAKQKKAAKEREQKRKVKKAELVEAGRPVDLLMAAHVSKDNTAAAEDIWLEERTGGKGFIPLGSIEEKEDWPDDEGGNIDPTDFVRNQY